jgi:hypothetical protein
MRLCAKSYLRSSLTVPGTGSDASETWLFAQCASAFPLATPTVTCGRARTSTNWIPNNATRCSHQRMSTKSFHCRADFTCEAPRGLSESPCDGLSGCAGTRASVHTSSMKRRRRSKLGVMVKPTRRRRAASSSGALFVHNHLRSPVADVRTRWGAGSTGKAGATSRRVFGTCQLRD